MKERDTVVLKIGDTQYEVGKHVSMAQAAGDESLNLDKRFCLSDEYLARLRGALYYMRGKDAKGIQYTPDHVELLVVGLPVNAFHDEDLRKSMITRLAGKHELPEGRSLVVDRVIVLPQPLGSFFEHAYKSGGLDTMVRQVNLLIDPGFHTFDWLLCDGMFPIDAKSSAVNRGMSAILSLMADEINKNEGFNTAALHSILHTLPRISSSVSPVTLVSVSYRPPWAIGQPDRLRATKPDRSKTRDTLSPTY